jgi:hypothetical protein
MLRYFDSKVRRRIAPIVLIAGLLFVGHTANEEIPRTQEVSYVLSDEQRKAESLRVSYAQAGETVIDIALRFAPSAPGVVSHSPSLRPGQYDVTIELTGRAFPGQVLSRTLTVPTEPRARIRLEEAYAR